MYSTINLSLEPKPETIGVVTPYSSVKSFLLQFPVLPPIVEGEAKGNKFTASSLIVSSAANEYGS